MNRTEKKINAGITIGLLFIWAVIIAFGIFTLISPDWLANLAVPGMNVEANENKTAADRFLKNGQNKQAITHYLKALKIMPDYTAAEANLAIAYQKSGQYSQAINTFQDLLNNNAEKPEVIYANLAEIAERTGHPDMATDYYLLAAKTAPYPEQNYQKAGKLAMDAKHWNEATDYFLKAVEHRLTMRNAYVGMLISDDKDSLYHIFTLYEKDTSWKNNYDERSFNQMLMTDNNLASTYNNIGMCQAKIEQYDDALRWFEKALTINPDFSVCRNNVVAVKQLMAARLPSLKTQ